LRAAIGFADGHDDAGDAKHATSVVMLIASMPKPAREQTQLVPALLIWLLGMMLQFKGTASYKGSNVSRVAAKGRLHITSNHWATLCLSPSELGDSLPLPL
jgi:hypothetical protein